MIAVFSIFITVLAMTAIFYSRLQKQVFSDLEVIAKLLSGKEELDRLPEDIRVTLIGGDGVVRYDSAADAASLENHLDRPEVRDALQKGSGQGVRRSDTLSSSVFYYALRLPNGQILRVGRQSASVVWLFVSAVPIVAVVALFLVAVCMAASHYLTRDIVSPIDTMVENMDHMDEWAIYEELVPFMEKIRTQHEEILAAANMRQEFTANVSHELKTPLTAISGYAELMEAGVAKDTDIKHFSHEIVRSASRLLTLINDIIKLSRLDEGVHGEALEMVDLSAVASDTVKELSISADKMDVSVNYKGCACAMVRIGKEMAQELAYNLIENAIRYNKPGGRVEVSVAKGNGAVTFTVSDTGIGIPKQHQERVFERFYRVDKSRSKELGGTGLGLAIVKHICSLTSGRITLESSEGQGTDVTVVWDDSKQFS